MGQVSCLCSLWKPFMPCECTKHSTQGLADSVGRGASWYSISFLGKGMATLQMQNPSWHVGADNHMWTSPPWYLEDLICSACLGVAAVGQGVSDVLLDELQWSSASTPGHRPIFWLARAIERDMHAVGEDCGYCLQRPNVVLLAGTPPPPPPTSLSGLRSSGLTAGTMRANGHRDATACAERQWTGWQLSQNAGSPAMLTMYVTQL
jgi:hypothetical protein